MSSVLTLLHEEANLQWSEERRRLEQYVLTPKQFYELVEELSTTRDQYAVGVDSKRGLEWVLVYLNGHKLRVIKGR